MHTRVQMRMDFICVQLNDNESQLICQAAAAQFYKIKKINDEFNHIVDLKDERIYKNQFKGDYKIYYHETI